MRSKRPLPLPPKQRMKIPIPTIGVFMIVITVLVLNVLNALNDARKPAIYLYPTEDSQVQVHVDVRGFMYADIPEYGDGWDVFVTTDGIIEGQYDYLFYEALLFKLDLPDEGWVVSYVELGAWMELQLPALGLNAKESQQFMEYWLAELPAANYYEIKLLDQEFVNEYLRLSVQPEPDTNIRLLFHFRPLTEKIDILEPSIVTPEREGFVLVEWGGILSD